MRVHLEVIDAGDVSSFYVLEGTAVTLGSSPLAGIPLVNASDLQGEHLELTPRREGCLVASRGAQPLPRFNGIEFERGIVAWGSEMELGHQRIRFYERAPKKGGKSSSVVGPIALAATVAIGGLALQFYDDEPVDKETKNQPPDIFVPAPACDAQGEAALVRANDAAEVASAKSERFVFEPRDGIEAVKLFEFAVNCYRVAGDQETARRAEVRAKSLRARLDDEYRGHRLRLKRAVDQDRYEDALVEIQALLDLTEHVDDPWVEWLGRLGRQLAQKVAASKDKQEKS